MQVNDGIDMVALGFAHPDEQALEEMRKLEEKHEIILIAYEKPPEPAELNHEQMLQLQALEKKTGYRLVAYR